MQGASKDAGMPLYNDLLSTPHIKNLMDVYELSSFVDPLFSISETYKNYDGGFENLLSELYINGNKDEYLKILVYYQNLLLAAETYSGMIFSENNQHISNWEKFENEKAGYYFIFGQILKKYFVKPTIISFNHDLFVEYGLVWENFNYGTISNRMISCVKFPKLSDFSDNISILKLHGSFNYLHCSNCDMISSASDYLWNSYHNIKCPKCKSDLYPYYVPPLKPNFPTVNFSFLMVS